MDQLTMFGQNIFLLIGLAMLLGIVGMVLFVLFMAWRVWRFERQQRAVERAFAEKLGKKGGPPLGSPPADAGGGTSPDPDLPPMAPGICNDCGRVFAQVYHLPGGERLCKVCFSKRPTRA